MPCLKKIVCLADSFKPPHGRCVAGRELWPDGSFGHWIRPISHRTGGELSHDECTSATGAVPRLLDILEVPLAAKAPGTIQSENHFICAGMRWIKVGELPRQRLPELEQSPWGIWGDHDHTTQGKLDCLSPAQAQQFLSSLLLIRVDSLTVHIGEHPRTKQPTCRGEFLYQDRNYNPSRVCCTCASRTCSALRRSCSTTSTAPSRSASPTAPPKPTRHGGPHEDLHARLHKEDGTELLR